MTKTNIKTPTHIAYQVRDSEDSKGYWTKIGTAWPHADGKGLTLHIDIIPLDGRVTLRNSSKPQPPEQHAQSSLLA